MLAVLKQIAFAEVEAAAAPHALRGLAFRVATHRVDMFKRERPAFDDMGVARTWLAQNQTDGCDLRPFSRVPDTV